MSNSVEMQGMDEILKKIEDLGKAGKKIQTNALKEGGNIILEESKKNLERNNNVRTGNLRDGLKVSGLKRKGGTQYVNVGVQKNDNSKIFYGKFIEWGTSKMASSPFLGTAFQSKKIEAARAIIGRLKKELNL